MGGRDSNDEAGSERQLDAFIAACRERGVRVTHQRIAVYRELLLLDNHPSAEEVHRNVSRHMPTLSLDTVYRTLSLLAEHDLISRVAVLSGRSRYEAKRERHHHFLCMRCGTVIDVHSDALDRLHDEMNLPQGVEVRSALVQFHGLCSACRDDGGCSR